jgi:hypothetical protein
MDFIVALPESDGYDKIWVIVDRLTKMAHFIPLTSGDPSPVSELAKAFAKEIWRLHGLPSKILSDRDSQFTSRFWNELMSHLGVTLKLSTAFRPQTDGQTEIVNQILEQCLRHFCSYQQDDWAELLPFAEYALNTATSKVTKCHHFLQIMVFNLRRNGHAPRRVQNGQTQEAKYYCLVGRQSGRTYGQTLRLPQKKNARYYDRKVMTPPDFKVGDLVMIVARNMKTKRPCKKLDHKKIGPVKILKNIGIRAFRVELPTTIEVHNVIHVSLLEPYRKSKFPGRHQPPPPPEEVEGEENLDVESVANSRYNKKRKRVEYLDFWKGFPLEQANWEPWESLEGTVKEAIQSFHKSNPKLPKDKRG